MNYLKKKKPLGKNNSSEKQDIFEKNLKKKKKPLENKMS